MRFLILGLGSIGQRHCRILRNLLGAEVELFAYRQRKLNIVINDDMTAETDSSPEEEYGVTLVDSMDEAMAMELDGVYVTNPISMHIDTALVAARAGHNLFIEKPLSHNQEGIDELLKVVEEKQLITFVGYQLRYHIALKVLKDQLDKSVVGNIISADIHFGEWLPGMHPYEDYRESHASRSDQGGGVVLCLSHEIDFTKWLFGMPRTVFCQGGHLSDLEMDGVEDSVDMLLDFGQQKNRMLPVHIHLDFVQRPPRRYVLIVGDQGTLYWDYFTNTIKCDMHGASASWTKTFNGWQRNDMFTNEISNFLSSIRGETESDIPLSDAVSTARICLSALESMKTGNVVQLNGA